MDCSKEKKMIDEKQIRQDAIIRALENRLNAARTETILRDAEIAVLQAKLEEAERQLSVAVEELETLKTPVLNLEKSNGLGEGSSLNS
jgi:chromosome segregation ATPase